jgi:uncharacterized Zn finger protein
MTQTPQVGRPEKCGSGWFVPSGTAGVGDTVERLEGRWRCTCPSFRWRKTRTCKHIMAVRAVVRQQVGA